MEKRIAMKIKILFIGIAVFLVTVSVGHSWKSALLEPREKEQLMGLLGSNWSIAEKGERLIITSKEKMWFYNAVSLPYMEGKELVKYIKSSGRRDWYEIKLLFVAKWDRKRWNMAREKNDKIWEKISGLPKKHGLTHLTRNKMNSFFPETDQDKVKIQAYEKERRGLKETLIVLPDYHSARHSIHRSDNRMGFEAVWSESGSSIDFSKVFRTEPHG
jgi:hypothetical protein